MSRTSKSCGLFAIHFPGKKTIIKRFFRRMSPIELGARAFFNPPNKCITYT